MASWLHEIFVDIWQTEEMVDDWTTAIRVRLCKVEVDKQV